MYGYHIRMNTIKDDRNNEDKNDYNLKNVMSVDFTALRKLLLLSQKNLHLFFFAKTRTGIKHLKVFYINTMCPLCHLS